MWFIIGFLIFFLIVGIAIIPLRRAEENKEKLKKYMSSGDNILIKFANDSYGIELDKNIGSINIYKLAGNQIDKISLSINKLLSSEVTENGISIYKTNRGSQIGGAVIGGALVGGVGAIIGGLSGSTRQEERCKYLLLKLIFNDFRNPKYEIYFLQCPFDDGYAKDSVIYTAALKEIDNFLSYIAIMEKQNYQDFETTIEKIDITPSPGSHEDGATL